MKKIIYTLLLLFVGLISIQAQVVDTLPTNHEAFVKELKQKFDETNRSDLKTLFKEFELQLKENKIPSHVLDKLIASSNQILAMRGKAYPQLQGVLEKYLALNAIPLETNEWEQFQNTLMQVMTNAKKGDTKSSLEFMDFAIPLYKENALYFSVAKVWSLKDSNFKLSYDESVGPVVTVANTVLKGRTVGDSLEIKNTTGKYTVNTTTWNGDKGIVDWTRAGLPSNEVYANFEAYEIDLNTQGYSVPNVVFTYKNYFESTIPGKLEDKMITAANAETTRFPRFSAERKDVPAQQITENVFYYGGFTLAGSKVLGGSDDEKSELIIYKQNSKQKVLRAITNSITINLPEKISSSNSEISLYFDTDSIYHPSINLFYDLTTNTIKLVKGEGSLAQTSFSDSYHNIDFDVDVLVWNLDEDNISLSTITTSGLKAANFESKDYFSEQKMKALRGNVSYDPLSILRKYTETNMQNYIYASEFAKLISANLTVQQIKPVLFNLVQEGFINFDEKTEKIEVKDKVNHYVLANAKKRDFDNITIVSNDKKANAQLNLRTKNMDLSGVKSVPVSLANSTIFFPDSQKITIEKNRDMTFNGLFFSGRFDFFGKNNHFLYEDFNMDLPQIDTLIINIPDGDKLDQYGNPRLRPINSTLQELKGSLNINIPINKSGNSELAQFPIFESKSSSKVFYDSPSTRGGTYSREDFFYEIKPFIIDSLMYINEQTLRFDGKLYSGGIFPEINEPLRLQEDLSLGFKVTSPSEGFDVYGGKGKFISNIELNNEGLTGSGVIKYKTTSFESSKILFFPDSLMAVTDTFGVEESKGDYESPWVKSSNNRIEWYPYLDSMVAYSDKTTPFEMFGERIKLDGVLEITDEGIHGAGVADWNDAQLTSNRFKFNSEELLADTAELKIKTIDGDKVTFNTPNVNAYVDFRGNTGYFKSNTNENRTEFNYNQYATTIDEFFWDIDNKKLEFSVPEGSEGAPFISLNQAQDSLSFIAKKADYNLETSIIEASGVSEIFIADSRVIPKDGKVTVYPEAKMETLEGATIEATTESKRHIMEDVTITINGKYDIKASGKYRYEAKNIPVQYVKLPKIEVIVGDSSQMDKKKQVIQKIIHAKGLVSQSEDFYVYPDVQFYGDLDIYSTLNDVKIKGFVKVDFKTPYIVSDFLQIDGNVDADSLDLTLDGAKDPQGKDIRTGIFVNKVGIRPIYTNILNNQIGPLDVALLETNGILKHNSDLGLYTFGDPVKMSSEKIMKGNILKFSPSDNKIEGQGSFDFALAYGALEEKIAGKVNTDLIENEYEFSTSIALPLGFDKTILEKIAYYLYEDNFDSDDIEYTDDLLFHWAEFVGEKSLDKMQEEIGLNGLFTRPKDLNADLMFTNVKLKYYPQERVYRSEGKFGLAFVGEKGVHKMISGYLEFGHRMGSDYMNIYLQTSYNDYVYITYTTTLMEVASSFTDVVGAVNAIDPSKRKIKGESNTFYLYTGINELKARGFMQRMKILEEGGTLPPPEPPRIKTIGPPADNANGEGGQLNGEETNEEKGKGAKLNLQNDTPDAEEESGNGAKLNIGKEGSDAEETPIDADESTDAENEGKKKSKKDDSEEVEELDEEAAPQNSGVPQEVLDFENNSGKGKKNKGQ